MKNNLPEKTEFLLYKTEDGQIQIETRMQDETVWLSLNQMAELFGVDKSGISRHLKNILESGELSRNSVVAIFATTASDGKKYQVEYYNLDAIISVGYRVNSIRGTQFRIWATQRLREYLIKGFTMDDERLKLGGDGNYFDELLARIRDIRSSEKVFWRKVLNIYATSIDYDPQSELSQEFFANVQNKMHWAAHGHTAAEIIYDRVDAGKENMGLTNWVGDKIRKSEVAIAKNYLNQDELELLNRIVTAYLEFAELQALNRYPMYMRDWIQQLDMFLSMSKRKLLEHAGSISHEEALKKAQIEYEKYRQKQLEQPSKVEKHFIEAEKEIKQISSKRVKNDDSL
ncbi:MAG: cell filamentation protein Fic [Lentisphaerae bacterium GWF2_44_16]|nr:MAG: cell filamentation protein Fic [Lentisphaerae bacterium GWF2_44_16]